MARIIRIFILVAFPLVSAELVCRIIFLQPGTLWFSAYRPPINFHNLEIGLIRDTPTGRRLTPNLELLATSPYSAAKSFAIKTNSFGIRGPEPDPMHSRKRILFLGDSVTWSNYLAESETFPIILQTEFYDQIEVINAAIGATGVDNYLAILKEVGPQLRPDLIIVGIYLNDATPSPAYISPALPFPLNHSVYLSLLWDGLSRSNYLQSNSYITLIESATVLGSDIEDNFDSHEGVTSTECSNTLRAAIASAKLDWGLGWSNKAWEQIQKRISEINDWSNRHNTRVAALLFPVTFQLCNKENESFPSLKFRKIMTELKIPYLDVLNELKSYDPQQIYIDHCHFSAKGNELIADKLKEFMQANSLLQ